MKPSDDEIPLLYGPHAAPDSGPVVTPSEEDMARHLAAQMATLPLTVERTAQLAALDEATRVSGMPRDFDETSLLLVRTEVRPPQEVHEDIALALQKSVAPNAQATPAASPAPSRVAADAAPDELGPYRIHQRLGRGGMAAVYRASDTKSGHDVALKLLHASLCEDAEARARFIREARAAGALSHPHIVAVRAVGEIENRPFMAMELVPGMPLSAKLEAAGPLPLRQAVLIALQLARALDYAHGRGVVHRDIKPGNIVLLADGQTIKVTDFGIAHMAGLPADRSTAGTVLGTPQYMSPEQTRGEVVDGRSDLFSAGVVMYQMLAGERPFRADNLVALAARIATEDPPPLLRKRPDVPASLRRVVERCLAKSAQQRWQTGQALADALLRVLGEIETAEQAIVRQMQLPLRLKWTVAACVLTAVLMGGMSFLSTRQQASALLVSAGQAGSALVRNLAAQQSDPVLAGEWGQVDAQLQTAMRTGDFDRLLVLDGDNIVRASNIAADVGQTYRPEGLPLPELSAKGVQARRVGTADRSALSFEAPVVAQGKSLGRVILILDESPVTRSMQQSLLLLLAVGAAAVVVVAVIVFFASSLVVKPIRRVEEGMAEIGQGRLGHRIALSRRDELGHLYASFDAMAQALQRRSEGHESSRHSS